jgi:tetratricopeptide (TPR) repeat protein
MEEEGGKSESVTQLADSQPQIDTPLRILLPTSTNAPARSQGTCRDDHIGTNVFSPGAYAATLNLSDDSIGPNTRIPTLGIGAKGNSDSQARIKTAISHYTVLAFSSHRAGKKEVEASAYVSLAVIYDNLGNYKSAVEHYKSYLDICKETGDTHGQAVACNCLGVDYMFLSCTASDEGFINGFKATEQSLAYLDLALDYHQQHLQSADQGGKFVANINIGLCLGAKNEYSQAARYYQNSLRVAIKMQTLFGQSIAVGNLGMLAISKGDYPTARTCLEQVSFIFFLFPSLLTCSPSPLASSISAISSRC